jgi:CheY-like chemotaxis protein
MNKNGPVLIVDDDDDDRELLGEVFTKLNYENEIILLSDGQQAYDYLEETSEIPFLILSDIHMPKLSGPELRDKIEHNDKLRLMYIPFIYFTTATTKKAIAEAYAVSADGFFLKPNTYKELEISIQKIVGYWYDCQSPADYV